MNAVILRIIAMATMLTDHCNYLFNVSSLAWYIGRLSFPLYAFLLADSYLHLRSDSGRMKKYVFQLLILAVVSEFAYDYVAFGRWLDWRSQNQILQFLCFVLAALLADRLPHRWLRLPLWGIVIALNFLCNLGYYGLGIVTLLAVRWYLERYGSQSFCRRLMGAAAVMLVFCSGYVLQEVYFNFRTFVVDGTVYWDPIIYLFRTNSVTLLLIPVIALYNGQYGNPPRWFRVLYKYFYPAHLYGLSLITIYMGF